MVNSSVCIIGAGFSGLCLGIQLIRKLGSRDFVIFDQNNEVGGTWLESYPGCGPDLPGHLYSYSFEPKTDWSSAYVKQPEILAYLKSVAEKFGMSEYIRYRRIVQRLTWLESHKKWKAIILDMNTNSIQEFLFSLVVVAVGKFHSPNVPEQFMTFDGPIMHTALNFDAIDLRDKVVAVIGSGSSAVQIIPEILASNVKKLISYQRSPAWVLLKPQFQYSKLTKWCFAHLPGFRKVYRSLIFALNELNHTAFQRQTFLSHIGVRLGSTLGNITRSYGTQNERELRRKLSPKEKFGCSRPCLSNDYYSSLSLPNVTVITTKIFRVDKDSIMTEGGVSTKIDVIILATGFKIFDYFAPLEIFGDTHENMLDDWKQNGPLGYLGTFFSHMPNMFFLHGPGSDVGHNSGIFIFECQTEMIIKVFRKMRELQAKKVIINQSSVAAYSESRKLYLKKTVWGDTDCLLNSQNNKHISDWMYPNTLLFFWWQSKTLDVLKHFQFG